MSLSIKTKLGILIGVSVLAGLMSTSLAILLLVFAGFLIAWGQEPKGTEDFVSGLPLGNHLVKGLVQLDLLLANLITQR